MPHIQTKTGTYSVFVVDRKHTQNQLQVLSIDAVVIKPDMEDRTDFRR